MTAREKEVLALFAQGYTMQAIADKLGIAYKTVSSHLARIKKKTGVHKATLLVHYALEEGIIEVLERSR